MTTVYKMLKQIEFRSPFVSLTKITKKIRERVNRSDANLTQVESINITNINDA